MKKYLMPLCAALVLLVAAAPAKAGVITNGSLTITIREDNGAIDTALFGGSDYFNQGTHVSDYGFQNGTLTNTFHRNDTNGGTGQPVTVTGGTVATGTYTGGGLNIGFNRSYALVSGVNVLRVTTTLTNNATLGGGLISYFDTFDPDQGIAFALGFGTFNDVFALAGGTVGQASINAGPFQHTVIAGSLDARATVASGNPFQISNGTALNNFFSSPFDGNGAFADSGTHIGLRTNLNAGQSTTFVYDLAFGLTPASAQQDFITANAVSAVPEPATMTMLGIGVAGMFGFGLRRRRANTEATPA